MATVLVVTAAADDVSFWRGERMDRLVIKIGGTAGTAGCGCGC